LPASMWAMMPMFRVRLRGVSLGIVVLPPRGESFFRLKAEATKFY
jgi:hypothetical protein